MKNKIIIPIFLVLFLLSFIPFAFTESCTPLLFGWLPTPLAYWWILLVADLIFVFIVCRHFVKTSEKEEDPHG